MRIRDIFLTIRISNKVWRFFWENWEGAEFAKKIPKILKNCGGENWEGEEFAKKSILKTTFICHKCSHPNFFEFYRDSHGTYILSSDGIPELIY